MNLVIDIFLCEQIIPQSVCSRYGLAIGASVAPIVRLLVWICFPVAYPISKVTGFFFLFGPKVFLAKDG